LSLASVILLDKKESAVSSEAQHASGFSLSLVHRLDNTISRGKEAFPKVRVYPWR
jgi:hypothetical protein